MSPSASLVPLPQLHWVVRTHWYALSIYFCHSPVQLEVLVGRTLTDYNAPTRSRRYVDNTRVSYHAYCTPESTRKTEKPLLKLAPGGNLASCEGHPKAISLLSYAQKESVWKVLKKSRMQSRNWNTRSLQIRDIPITDTIAKKEDQKKRTELPGSGSSQTEVQARWLTRKAQRTCLRR